MEGKEGGSSMTSDGHVCLENVEIERKFTISADTESRIIQAGGACISDTVFTDTYFDTGNFNLTLSDHWLRCRNGNWELKAPLPVVDERTSTTKYTKYLEVTDENDIVKHLSAILTGGTVNSEPNVDPSHDPAHRELKWTVEKWLNYQKLKPFAEYTTQRKSFSFDEGVTVVLDTADFGFSVGEIEIMAGRSEEDAAVAMETIDRLAEKLGLATQPIAPGKMSAFLRRFSPQHYATLLAAGILQR